MVYCFRLICDEVVLLDYNTLLDLVVDLGYRMAISGAETFRVEESINRILESYGIASEAFAIPNCLIVSIETPDGRPMTRMRRIGYHGNDLDSVEKYNNLSRRLCAQAPDLALAAQWLKDTDASCTSYRFPVTLLGNFLGACGFSVLFGGSWLDSLCAGLCGLLVGLVNRLMDGWKANQFFRIIFAAFVMALPAYTMGALKIADNADAVVIGALMLLVPGLIFTNAMRDIIYGDTNSGINRIVQVFLIAAAIALGTGAAWNLSVAIWDAPTEAAAIIHPFYIQVIACLIGCAGFSILFNIHGPGGLLCALGGLLAWSVYILTQYLGGGDLTAYFWATFVSAVYSEKMARIRKYPAISYLVVSIFPLIPGAGVYRTMNYAVRGDMSAFAREGGHTIAIAGIMAVAILLVSTSVRIWSVWKMRQIKSKKNKTTNQ